MVRTYRPYDKRLPKKMPDPMTDNRAYFFLNQETGELLEKPFACLKCGEPLAHREAYDHALFRCPNRKE